MTETSRGTGPPTQQKKLGTGGRELDDDEDRQPTKTESRGLSEERGQIPLHRDTTIFNMQAKGCINYSRVLNVL